VENQICSNKKKWKKLILEKKIHCEFLDKASEVLKEALKQKAVTMNALKDVTIEFAKTIENIKKSKHEKEVAKMRERIKVVNYSQKIIASQMNNNITKEERDKLNAFLEDITPREGSVQRLKNNRSITKTLICASGAISIAYMVLKKNTK